MRNLMKPSVMLSNIWPQSRLEEGATLRGLESAVSLDFFEAIQVVDIPFPGERRAVAQLLREKGLPGNMAMTRILSLDGLNLSSLDANLRTRSVERIRASLDEVREAGMTYCTVISGPRPGPETDRLEGLRRFQESLHELCLAAEQSPALNLQFEPLDFFAHKRMTLGSAKEGLAIVRELRKSHSNIGLCLDTAHMLLNGEDLDETLATDLEEVSEFHFCNPCLDEENPRFGDRHLPFGFPGALDQDGIVDLMRKGKESGFFSSQRRPTVAFEVLRTEELHGLELLRYCRDLFLSCWKQACPEH